MVSAKAQVWVQCTGRRLSSAKILHLVGGVTVIPMLQPELIPQVFGGSKHWSSIPQADLSKMADMGIAGEVFQLWDCAPLQVPPVQWRVVDDWLPVPNWIPADVV